MTAQERAQELYPVNEGLTEEEKKFFLDSGMNEHDIKLMSCRLTANNVINKKLQEAYLLGRKEKEDYE